MSTGAGWRTLGIEPPGALMRTGRKATSLFSTYCGRAWSSFIALM